MKIILCFLVLAGLVALISAAPDDPKAAAAKAAADAAKAATDAAAKAKKEAEDTAKKVKGATDVPKAAKDIADDAKDAEKEAEKDAEKEAEKDAKRAKDCLKPHHGKGHLGILSTPIKIAAEIGEAVENFFVGGLELFGL